MNDHVMVDAHVHVFTQDMPLVGTPRHRPNYDFTTADLLRTFDAAGVQFGVIAAASPWGDYNDYTVEACRASKRLRGTVILNPSVERVVLEDMNAAGIVGVRLPLIGLKDLPDFTSFEWRRTFKRIADLGWHVHPHIEGARLPPILAMLEGTGVKIVVDHFARPEITGGIQCAGFQATLRSIERGRTWVKVSAAYRIGHALSATCGRELLRTVGADRLLWASDCPFVGHENQFTYPSTIDCVREWVTDPVDRAKVFGANALKLYFS
jgi:predicted TIM-barrel fold metal-dependent hydrolase